MSNNSNTYKDNCFVIDGVNSSDWGIIVSGDNVFDMPERDVDRISVPGRNGELIIDNGRWNNIDVTYNNCTIQENFASAFSDFRSEIGKRRGYVRLEDSFNTDEYRMANLSAGMHVNLLGTKYNSGVFDVTFNCKPQRFLKSGETPIQFLPPSVNGGIIHTAKIPTNSDLTFTISCEDTDTITATVYTYDSEESALTTNYFNDLANGDVETCTFDDTDIYFVLEFSGYSDLDSFSARIQTTTVYDGETVEIDAIMARTWYLTNPTGYAAKPLLKQYGTTLGSITLSNYENDERVEYYIFSSTSADATHIYLDCDMQYLYDDDGNNLTSLLFMTTMYSDVGEALVFPEFGKETIKLYMYSSYSYETTYGLGLLEIYPNWWRL